MSVPSPTSSLITSPALSTIYISLPAPPCKVSMPAPPFKVSLPAPPLSILLPLLPVKILSSALPVPLILAAPVRVRFSTFAPNTKLALACTLSIPAPAVSVTTSPALSTI